MYNDQTNTRAQSWYNLCLKLSYPGHQVFTTFGLEREWIMTESCGMQYKLGNKSDGWQLMYTMVTNISKPISSDANTQISENINRHLSLSLYIYIKQNHISTTPLRSIELKYSTPGWGIGCMVHLLQVALVLELLPSCVWQSTYWRSSHNLIHPPPLLPYQGFNSLKCLKTWCGNSITTNKSRALSFTNQNVFPACTVFKQKQPL